MNVAEVNHGNLDVIRLIGSVTVRRVSAAGD